MVETLCSCGRAIRVGADRVGSVVGCACGKRVLLAAGEAVDDAAAMGDFDARLIVAAGPAGSGDSIALGGIPDLEIGKAEERNIRLSGEKVSRAHAKLVRLDFGPSRWKVIDTNSRNGVWVNGQRVAEAELRDGDLLKIGDFHLKFAVATPAPVPVPAAIKVEVTCPSCGAGYAAKALICTECGTNLRTGKVLVTSRDLDEDALAIRADTWIRIVSWLVWLGLFPIASEAFGTHKPRATWIITGITIFISFFFLLGVYANKGQVPDQLRDYMLWVGNAHAADVAIADQQHRAEQEINRRIDQLKNLDSNRRGFSTSWVIAERNQRFDDARQRMLKELHSTLAQAAKQEQQQRGSFHWYQLLTNALLHGGIMHLAGNLCFLLVFGLRVNEVIGDLKMWIVYPLLAVLASAAVVITSGSQPLHPALGASGAIMGLAGMYFVFFPVHKVVMAVWIRGWLLTGFRVFYKVWRMPGFWLLILWISLNDVLPTLLGLQDHVAHWAHLGGFICGVLIALGLMLARQVDAHGADILSITLGRRAWALIGTPADRMSTKPMAVIPV